MLARRRFAACALCAVTGLAATRAEALPAGFSRKVLRQTDYPDGKHSIIEMLVEIDPHVLVARHTHPGVETGYIIAGGGSMSVQGEADRIVGAGDSFQIAPGVPHEVRNGAQKTRVLSTYVVEKGKPLASPAPA